MTTILNIADFRLLEPASEHLLNACKHLFLHFGVTHVEPSKHFPHSTLRLRMEVPCDDSVDALVEWEQAQDKVSDAYDNVREFMHVESTWDMRWIPCKNR